MLITQINCSDKNIFIQRGFVILNSLINEIITLLAVKKKITPLKKVAMTNKMNCVEYFLVNRTVGDIGSVSLL